jgi:DNA-binding PadR family transcriptional regulator
MIGKQPRIDFIELHILHHASVEELYGLWMIEELASHGYRVSASQLYPKFHGLEKNGRLRRRERVVGGKVRKYYRATASGKQYLRRQKSKLIELVAEVLTEEEFRRCIERRSATSGPSANAGRR